MSVAGKFLAIGDTKLYPRGATYGPFEPNADGVEYADLARVERDFASMAARGFTAVQIPHTVPPLAVLDAAERNGLHVMASLGAELYAGRLTDGRGSTDVARIVRERVREVAGHPAILCLALGNAIPAGIVRWAGRRRVEHHLGTLYDVVKSESPDAVVTYVNAPATEHLELPFLELLTFDVYLAESKLSVWLERLQEIAGDRPLLLSGLGLDARRHGPSVQARSLARQIRTAYSGGCAGTFVCSWTDEWYRDCAQVEDWAFGLTRVDRSARPALDTVQAAYADVPFPDDAPWPSVTVVVCTSNGARSLPTCLAALRRVDYPDFEVVVVDRGSTDNSAAIATAFGARVIRTEEDGLGSARNVGASAAVGEIVAYLDDDAAPDVHWLRYLADSFLHSDAVAVGGPAVPPLGASLLADCIAHSPGGTADALHAAESAGLRRCNMAIRRHALEQLGGFDARFRSAGDDVDLAWRIRGSGAHIRSNPGAMIWHHEPDTVRGYLRRHRDYGRADALLERKWPDRFDSQRTRESVVDSLVRTPEWYLVLASLGLMSVCALAWSPLAIALPLLVVAVSLHVLGAVHRARGARFGNRRRVLRRRAVTALLELARPIARMWGRVGDDSSLGRRLPARMALPRPRKLTVSPEQRRLPEEVLFGIQQGARDAHLAVTKGAADDRWDLKARGGVFGATRLRFYTEDLGAGKQRFHFALRPAPSRVAVLLGLGLAAIAIVATLAGAWPAGVALGAASLVLLAATATDCGRSIAVLLRLVPSVDGDDPALAILAQRQTLELHPDRLA